MSQQHVTAQRKHRERRKILLRFQGLKTGVNYMLSGIQLSTGHLNYDIIFDINVSDWRSAIKYNKTQSCEREKKNPHRHDLC